MVAGFDEDDCDLILITLLVFLGVMLVSIASSLVGVVTQNKIELVADISVETGDTYTIDYINAPVECALTAEYYYNADFGILVKVDEDENVVYPNEFDGQSIQGLEGYELVTGDIVITHEAYESLSQYY